MPDRNFATVYLRDVFLAGFFLAVVFLVVFLAVFFAAFFAVFFLVADLSGACVRADAASFLISELVNLSGVRSALLANDATALDVLSFLAIF